MPKPFKKIIQTAFEDVFAVHKPFTYSFKSVLGMFFNTPKKLPNDPSVTGTLLNIGEWVLWGLGAAMFAFATNTVTLLTEFPMNVIENKLQDWAEQRQNANKPIQARLLRALAAPLTIVRALIRTVTAPKNSFNAAVKFEDNPTLKNFITNQTARKVIAGVLAVGSLVLSGAFYGAVAATLAGAPLAGIAAFHLPQITLPSVMSALSPIMHFSMMLAPMFSGFKTIIATVKESHAQRKATQNAQTEQETTNSPYVKAGEAVQKFIQALKKVKINSTPNPQKGSADVYLSQKFKGLAEAQATDQNTLTERLNAMSTVLNDILNNPNNPNNPKELLSTELLNDLTNHLKVFLRALKNIKPNTIPVNLENPQQKALESAKNHLSSHIQNFEAISQKIEHLLTPGSHGTSMSGLLRPDTNAPKAQAQDPTATIAKAPKAPGPLVPKSRQDDVANRSRPSHARRSSF